MEPSDVLANEKTGDWAAIYPRKNGRGGFIVAYAKNDAGFPDPQLFKYKSEKKFRMAWASFERSLETHDPVEGDYIIWENGQFNWGVWVDAPAQPRQLLGMAGRLQDAARGVVNHHAEHGRIGLTMPDVWITDPVAEDWVLFDAVSYLQDFE